MEILVPIMGILIVLVPVTGLTAVLTLRLGGKPFIETLAREMKGVGHGRGSEPGLQLDELAERVDALTLELHELRAAQAFDRKLVQGRSPSAETTQA
jgi:hypothetical protein